MIDSIPIALPTLHQQHNKKSQKIQETKAPSPPPPPIHYTKLQLTWGQVTRSRLWWSISSTVVRYMWLLWSLPNALESSDVFIVSKWTYSHCALTKFHATYNIHCCSALVVFSSAHVFFYYQFTMKSDLLFGIAQSMLKSKHCFYVDLSIITSHFVENHNSE